MTMIHSNLEIPLYRTELVRDRNIQFKDCSETESAAEIFHTLLDNSPIEKMVVLFMDGAGKFVGCEIVGMGTIDRVATAFPEIFRGAIVAGVNKIILGHNHPSGNATPSEADITMTELTNFAAKIFDIIVWDHIIVAPNGTHFSMADPKNKPEMNRIINIIRTKETLNIINGFNYETLLGISNKGTI